MILDVKVPQLPESVSEATLAKWHKKLGDYVERDENLVDVETDKVVLELPAQQAGVLVEILKGEGESAISLELIARIDTEVKATQAPPENGNLLQTRAVDKARAIDAAESAGINPDALGFGTAVMPAARKLADETGVDTDNVQGTGRGARVLKEDVQKAASVAPAEKPVKSAPVVASAGAQVGARPEQRVPMSRLRQRVAERLVASQHTAAILTTFNEVNMQPVMALRSRYKDRFEKEHGVKLGFMSFFVKAAIHGLKKFPIVNASVDGNDIVYHGYFDISIAVGSPRGLVVPVLRDVDQMSFADIEKKISDYGQRAQEGKLTVEELSGGTFTLSNGGIFGSMLSTPIINPPQSAILGMHATRERAVVENGQVVVRPVMYLALSYDHRIIDGREAVLTLVAIKEILEDPARLILDL